MAIHLTMLGRPQIIGCSGPVPVPAKALGLLAYLALHAEPQPRERLIELLWPDHAPNQGRKLLRNLLWRLRLDLDADVVTAAGDRLALGRMVWVDVSEFAKTCELALYRGDLLDGLNVRATPEFDSWLLSERDRWRSTFAKTIGRCIAEQRTLGHWDEVETLARRGLIYVASSEELHRALMEALAHLGQRAGALQHYEAWRRQCREQLDIEPASETQRLYRAIAADELSTATTSSLRVSASRFPDIAGAQTHDPLLPQAGSLGMGRAALSPYGSQLSPLQYLGMGWQLAWYGDSAEASRAFEAAYSGFMSLGDGRAAAQACCELAILTINSGRWSDGAQWLESCQVLELSSREAALQRLQQCLLGLIQVQQSRNEALLATAATFTQQVVPQMLAASRCELAHGLATRGLLDAVAHAAIEQLALRHK